MMKYSIFIDCKVVITFSLPFLKERYSSLHILKGNPLKNLNYIRNGQLCYLFDSLKRFVKKSSTFYSEGVKCDFNAVLLKPFDRTTELLLCYKNSFETIFLQNNFLLIDLLK